MDTNRSDVADQGHRYSVDEAEKLTGITQQQVSKWRRRLKEPEKYRAMLFGAVYHKALALDKVGGQSYLVRPSI